MDNLNFTKEDFSKLTLEEIKKFNINKIKIQNRFLIFYLIGENQIEILKNLIDELDLNVKELGYSPLLEACYENNFEIVKLLLPRGVNVNFKRRHCTPLLFACCYINFEMITLLLDNGAIPEVDEEGNYKCLRGAKKRNKKKMKDFIFQIQTQNIKKS